MRRARWLAPWKDSYERPVIYHCVTRVVERRLAFGVDEKEQFRTYMRMYENFSGCRVLSYCLMGNHVHILLEVPPMKHGGLTDEELLKRLGAICPSEGDWAGLEGCLVRMSEPHAGARVWPTGHDFEVYRRNGRQRIPLLAPWW